MKLGFLYLLSLFFFQFILPKSAMAHGFSKPFDLPIPPPFFLFGVFAVVIISLILASPFLPRVNTKKIYYSRFYLLKIHFFRFFVSRLFAATIKTFFVFILFLLILAGLFGKQNSALTITPVAVWIVFGIGLIYISALFGNIWQFINPVKTIFEWLDCISWHFFGKRLALNITYPKKWNMWLAVILFFIYLWMENIFGRSPPFTLSLLILLYVSLTLQGMFLFGKETWLRYADPFSVLFNLLSKGSLVDDRLYLRPPFIGLTQSSKESASHTIFILLFLAGLVFDQLRETIFWYRQTNFLVILNLPHELTVIISLLFLFILLSLIYFFLASLMKVPVQRFVNAFIPVALGFGIAHSLVPFLIDGQRILYLISDPLGFGWNLFGTAHLYQSYSITYASALWRTQIILVLGGLIASVYVAYILVERKRYLMIIFLALYTLFNLWLLSLPLIGKG